jgi:hypothetical protein
MALVAVAAAAASLSVTGCAGTSKPKAEPVRLVPTAVVPTALEAEGLTIQPNTTVEVKQALDSLGRQLLVSDARLWELHAGSRLVGALQVATLKARVDPTKGADRNAIIGQVLGSRHRQISVKGQPVWSLPNDGSDRAIYVWFGAHTFAVLQLKGSAVAAPQVATDLIAKIAAQPAWHALPPQVYRSG